MSEIQFNRSAINPGDCIGRGWTIVTGNLGTYIGVAVVTFIIYIVISLIPFINLLNFLLVGPLMGGIYYMAIKDVDGEHADFGMMFNGFTKIGPLVLISLIQNLPGIIIILLQYTGQLALMFGIPLPSRGRGDFFQAAQPDIGILAGLSALIIVFFVVYLIFAIMWALVFYFSIPLVMDKDVGVIEAISLSARAAFSNAGGTIALMILSGLVIILGFIAICLGLLVAVPVTWVATAVAYRAVFPRPTGSRWDTPPPPSAYGSIFNQGT